MLGDYDCRGERIHIRDVRAAIATRALVCSSNCGEHEVLCRHAGRGQRLSLQGHAHAGGAGRGRVRGRERRRCDGAELLGSLLRRISDVSSEVLEPRGLSLSRLTTREQDVLRLVADGHPTREVAKHLSYSERTIKNIIHDAVTKLNARTRSQAVAEAVREGLI